MASDAVELLPTKYLSPSSGEVQLLDLTAHVQTCGERIFLRNSELDEEGEMQRDTATWRSNGEMIYKSAATKGTCTPETD